MKAPEDWMRLCLSLAETAASLGEVPVGAALVYQDKLIATGFNLRETKHDSSAHAEMLAIRRGSEVLSQWRLSDCDLYVTLEPCVMCAGALSQARIRHVYFGASDPKGGALGSLYQIHDDQRLNHRFPITGNILHEECGQLLKTFFKARR